MIPETTEHPPWYRQPWMWLVVGIPVVSVISIVVMVIISVKYRDDLVRDDWYKAGRAINQDIDAEKLAKSMGLQATATLDPAALVMHVSIDNGATLPARLTLTLVHATMASEDMVVLLERGADGTWRGTLPRLPFGKRHLMLEPIVDGGAHSRWRLRATDVVFQGAPVLLLPVG